MSGSLFQRNNPRWRHIFMPRHIMAGAYCVTLFRHSVLSSFRPSVILKFRHQQFPFIILVTVAHIQLKFDISCGYIMRKYRSSSNLVMVWWFKAELCPFYFENNMKFSVSVHYLSNGYTLLTQTWHMDMSWENTGHVRIWSWFDVFGQSYAPFTLKIIWIFSSRSLSPQELYIFNSN
jgi:hypothetical protein